MRRIREVLRLRAELGPNSSAISAGAKLARSTVRAYLDRAAPAGLDAAAADGLSETVLRRWRFTRRHRPRIARYCSLQLRVRTRLSPSYRATIRPKVFHGRKSINWAKSVLPVFIGDSKENPGSMLRFSNRGHRFLR